MTEEHQRDPRQRVEPAELVEEDPSAKFAYDLATKPPIKDVASVKAASDIFDANTEQDTRPPRQSSDKRS